jgi:hypothetical protein
VSADTYTWAVNHTAPDESFAEGQADALLYINDDMVCECCAVIYCLHDNVTWLLPEGGVSWQMEEEPPYENPAARCNDCGMTATLTQMEEAANAIWNT